MGFLWPEYKVEAEVISLEGKKMPFEPSVAEMSGWILMWYTVLSGLTTNSCLLPAQCT